MRRTRLIWNNKAEAGDVRNRGESGDTQNNLNDSGTPTSVSLQGLLAVIDNAIEIDFGTGGIGGSPNSTTADGYYTLTFS